jgi:hypothetical protein
MGTVLFWLSCRNVNLNGEVLIQLSPHTHMRHVRLFPVGCHRTQRLLYASGTALSCRSFWASGTSDNLVFPDEAYVP